MPIETNIPPTGNPLWGPGFLTTVRLVGETPNPGVWQWIWIWKRTVEDPVGVIVHQQPTTDPLVASTFQLSRTTDWTYGWTPQVGMQHQALNALQVQLQVDGLVQTSVTIPITTDLQSVVQQDTARMQVQTPTEGSFTEDDRIVLMQAQGGILRILTDVLLEPVAEWLASYLPRPYHPIPHGALICDETIITRPSLPALNRWTGVRWKLVQWPSGLGIVDGFPDHTYASWGQISLCKENDDATVIPYETRYLATLEGELLWGTNEPTNVQVYVLPGACAEFWMLQSPPWAAQTEAA